MRMCRDAKRVTIPQDIALLDNAVPDKGLQDMYSNELKAFLYQHAEDERMHITEYRNVTISSRIRASMLVYFDRSGTV